MAQNPLRAKTEVLNAICDQARSCTACDLHQERTNVVFHSGRADADIVLVGEAPGENEDRTGSPFVGRSGQLLDDVLCRIGTTRDDVYVCNAVKCRPPSNRPPTAIEVAACAGFLSRQLDVVGAPVVVVLGASAARALKVPFKALRDVRGQVLTIDGRCVIVTIHPAYALRNRPLNEPLLEQDLALALALARGQRSV